MFGSDGVYHGINGNVSLDRRVITSPIRYDSTTLSDKSSSLSRSEGGVYDVGQAERSAIQQQQENIVNNNLYPMNGNSTLDSQDGDSARKRVRCSVILGSSFCLNFNNYFSCVCFIVFRCRNGQPINRIFWQKKFS